VFAAGAGEGQADGTAVAAVLVEAVGTDVIATAVETDQAVQTGTVAMRSMVATDSAAVDNAVAAAVVDTAVAVGTADAAFVEIVALAVAIAAVAAAEVVAAHQQAGFGQG